MNPPHRSLLPTFAALGSVLLFSTGGLAIKSIPLTALPIAGLRGLFASVFLILYLISIGRGRRILYMSRYGWYGALCYVGMTTTYVLAMKWTTAANAIFLQYTMPAWVLIGGALWLNERITWGRVVTVLLSLIGMAFFFMGQLAPLEWKGNITALLAGLCFAGLVLALRRDRERDPIDAVFWGNTIAAVLVLPMAWMVEPDFLTKLSLPPAWIGLLWLGIFQIGLAYILYVRAINHLPAIEVAILSLIEPVLNPTWVYFSLAETPSGWAVIGGVIILLSVLLHSFLGQQVVDEVEAHPEVAAK